MAGSPGQEITPAQVQQPNAMAPQTGTTQGLSSLMAGGKGGAKPQMTAMGTPIVYGKTYLPDPVNTQPNAGVPVTQSSDTIYDGGGGGGDGGFANGTMSVQGYARGTTGAEDDDPWNWTKKEQVAPLSASIKPSEAVIPQAVPDQTEKYLGNQATSMGTNAAAKGIDAGYKAYTASAPLAAMPVAEAAAFDLALGGLGGTAGATALQGATATSAATAGGEAALAAMGPVGMVIGGALLAKKLGIF